MNTRYFRLLSYFAEVAKAGSIRGAAAQLGLSPAVISAALFDLEEVLGATLFRRSTRRMELTHEGRTFLAKSVTVLDAFEAVFDGVNSPATKIEGRVSISLPSELAAAWIPSVIKDFKAEHPQVETKIHADDAKIDPRESDYDIAMRMEFQENPRLGRNGVTAYPLELVCAAGFADELSGSVQRDLDRIGFMSSAHQLRNGRLHCVEADTQRGMPLSVQPAVSIENRQVVLDLARKGFGAALLLSISVEEDLRTKRLIRVNPNYSFGYVVARTIMLDKRPSGAARAFRDFVAQRCTKTA